MRYVPIALLIGLVSLTGFAQAPSAEFEVASIKRSTSDRPLPAAPSSPGQFVLRSATAHAMVAIAYHDPLPFQIVGLPGWADAERYDIVTKGRPESTQQERQQMWRALFADRLKLRVHYEQRPLPAYKLVVARADGRLGPQLRASLCAPPEPGPTFVEKMNAADTARIATERERRVATPQEERAMFAMCGPIIAGNTLYAGGVSMEGFAIALRVLGHLDRPLVEGTGLHGTYAIKLTAAPPPVGPPSPDDPPTLLSALPEQLGLKLESATMDGTVLIIDHIERPTEN